MTESELSEPVDGDVIDYEFIDRGTVIITVEDNDGAIIKETYKWDSGEVVSFPEDEG